jgi:uncharacterized repeat protein (TIGR03806 family)
LVGYALTRLCNHIRAELVQNSMCTYFYRERPRWLWPFLAVVLTLPALAVEMPPVSINVEERPARSIRAYNLFLDVAEQRPNAGLMPYDINAPLFSDYAKKYRFLYLPPGTQAIYRTEQPFDFPVGSVLVKTFTYPADRRIPDSEERVIETRLLVHRPDGWAGYPYVWNEELTDARLAVAGARIPISWIHDDGSEREMVYSIPNMNQCKLCHEDNDVMGPIGPQARQLNRTRTYGAGERNQLEHWIKRGILQDAPMKLDLVPYMPPWNDSSVLIDTRGRAYLDGNCAHCHSLGGDAKFRGLDFTWYEEDSEASGPKPSRPVYSFCLERLRTTVPWRVMPRVGRTLPHDEGNALLEEWTAAIQSGLEAPNLLHSKR